jgi:hypothetical protein
MRRVMGFAVVAAVVALAASATAGAGSGGAERIPISCQSEWDPQSGTTAIYLFAPDTPEIPVGISGFLPYTSADGSGVFTPSGRMNISCTSNHSYVNPAGATWNGTTPCILFRGGADFSLAGSSVYRGDGHVVVTSSGSVLITCNGAFTGIATDPTHIP